MPDEIKPPELPRLWAASIATDYVGDLLEYLARFAKQPAEDSGLAKAIRQVHAERTGVQSTPEWEELKKRNEKLEDKHARMTTKLVDLLSAPPHNDRYRKDEGDQTKWYLEEALDTYVEGVNVAKIIELEKESGVQVDLLWERHITIKTLEDELEKLKATRDENAGAAEKMATFRRILEGK